MARTSRKKSIIDDIPKVKIYKTGIYARRSNENQSNETIESQIDEVKNYIRLHHNFKLVDVYAEE